MESTDPSRLLADLLDRLPAAQAIGIADPELADQQLAADEIVLGIGIGPARASGLLAAAHRAGSAAVLLRAPVGKQLNQLAGELGVQLHELPGAVSWHELHQQLLRRLNPAVVHAGDELADLAQTIATLTGGLVTIEDASSSRVLAYSRSSDEVDDLRRLSILGRSGPPEYLALLREWGVYDRLAGSEEVVEIAEHPASGVRRRLAVGVFAGDRQLGTIWVQQGSSDFGPHASQALLGAARLTAQYLVSSTAGNRADRRGTGIGGRIGGDTSSDTSSDLAAILAGRVELARSGLGRAASRPCAVAVIVAGPADRDPAASRRHLDELTTIATVHAAAFRRNALAGHLDGRVYLLLPNLNSITPALDLLADLIAAARRHLDPDTRAVLGSLAESVAGAPESRRAAEAALTVASTEPVLSFDSARPRLVTNLIENCLSQQPELQNPRLAELIAKDPSSASTLLGYLDTGSDVARVATAAGLHPTTVRYRLRRVQADLGLDLTDPDARLAAQVQLRCGLRSGDKER